MMRVHRVRRRVLINSSVVVCLFPVSSSLCEEIGKMRRKLQRTRKETTLFLDETAMRLSEAPKSTIVLPGEKKYVVATDTTSYAKRYDMIACISGTKTFAPCIFSPKERAQAGVKGINTEMLVDYVYSSLGQETAAIDKPPLTLVVDRSSIHNEAKVIDAFKERGGHVMGLEKMPPMAAKRMSPLDNGLLHDWKESVRKHGPLTLTNMEQVMADEWNRISPRKIKAHYRHCGLMWGTDVYSDCPDPVAHTHKTR
jgi:hypothetical protein